MSGVGNTPDPATPAEHELVYREGFRQFAPDHPQWYVVGPLGAVEVWSFGDKHVPTHPEFDSLLGGYLGGVEFHYINPPEYLRDLNDDRPSQDSCFLLGGKPCWHDGSALAASERYLPMAFGGEDMRVILADLYQREMVEAVRRG